MNWYTYIMMEDIVRYLAWNSLKHTGYKTQLKLFTEKCMSYRRGGIKAELTANNSSFYT